MSQNILNTLVFNSGSSSLKFSLLGYPGAHTIINGSVNLSVECPILSILENGGTPEKLSLGSKDLTTITARIFERLSTRTSSIEAVGHRVVHGGSAFHETVRIDERVEDAINELGRFAPLHNPAALEVIKASEQSLGKVPQFAVFDTSFYACLPRASAIYPLPYEWFENWGIRRYGFHGISHAWSVKRAIELMNDRKNLRIVTCHLGNGCSITATRDGKAIATSMGFTPMDGVMMGTRSGAIDPGIFLYVQREQKVSLSALDDILNHRSGLLGVSGVSSDFQILEKAAQSGHERASLAVEIFAASIRSAIGGMAVSLGGVDVLVFTGGIGEHAVALRSAVCEGLQCLNIVLRPDCNATNQTDLNIAGSASGVHIFIIEAREDLMIAGECRRLLLN